MEREKQKEEWHFNARVRLARIAIAMSQEFRGGHDAEQTERYLELYEEQMQLQCDVQLHDAFDPPEYKPWRQVG